MTWENVYLRTRWHLDPSSRLAATDIGRKLGRLYPCGGGQLGSHLTQWCLGRELPSHQVASWSIQPFGHKRHGPKIVGYAPLGAGRAGSPTPHVKQCGQGRGLPLYQVASWSIYPFRHNRRGPKICSSFSLGVWVPSNTTWPGRGLPPYQVAPLSIQPFGHNTWAENWGGATVSPFDEWKLVPHLTQCRLGRGLYVRAKWHLDRSSRLATTDMGENWGLSPFLWGSWVPI